MKMRLTVKRTSTCRIAAVATKMTDRCGKLHTRGRSRGLRRAAAGRLGSGQRGAGPRCGVLQPVQLVLRELASRFKHGLSSSDKKTDHFCQKYRHLSVLSYHWHSGPPRSRSALLGSQAKGSSTPQDRSMFSQRIFCNQPVLVVVVVRMRMISGGDDDGVASKF